MKQAKINIEIGKPLKIIESLDVETDKKDSSYSLAIISTLKNYQKAIQNFVNGKYANQKDLTPSHFKESCNIYVFICNDGIFIRYDVVNEGEGKVRVSVTEKSLIEIAPMFSDFVVHFPKEFSNYLPEIRGPQIVMTKGNIENPQTDVQEIFKFNFEIFAKKELPDGYIVAPPPARPLALVSLSNEMSFFLEGVLSPSEITFKELNKVEKFITHSTIKLNVGWLAIEVYPLLPIEHWKPEYALLWAELDILSLLAQKNALKTELTRFDSRNESRKYYSNLLKEFENLLGGIEEPVHQFLKNHPELLCPSHETCWSKVHFGNTISDFVFKEAYNDYQLVEIEAPIRELFRKDGQQKQELTHAINQIMDWVQFIQNNKQKVENELGLIGISTNPRTLVVIGRSASLTEENRRKIETLQAQQNKLRIMTYDDVLLNAKESLSRILGSLDNWGQNMEIYFSDK